MSLSLFAGAAVVCTGPTVQAQTTLPAALSGTFTTSSTLATGTGLTLNLGLGVEYLVVGGGGGGGAAQWNFAAGGGGGGQVTSGTVALAADTLPKS